MPAANKCQITLGDSCLEIKSEPIIDNASELLPKSCISGVSPTPFKEKPEPPNDQYWVYRFDTVTVIRIYIVDGRHFDVELQEVTNQPTWSLGSVFGLQAAVSDINVWLAGEDINPVTIGQLFSNEFDSGDWTEENNLGTTWTYNANSIDVSGPAGSFAPTIRYNKWFSQSENFEVKARYIVISDGVFLGVGVKTVSAMSSGTDFYAYMSTNPSDPTYVPGSIIIIRVNGTTPVFLAQDTINLVSYSLGDEIEVTFKSSYNTFEATFQNITNIGPIRSLTYTDPSPFTYPLPSNSLPSIFQVAFQCTRGDFKITQWSYSLNDKKNIHLLIIGDSKTEGYYADTFAKRYAGLWQSNNPSKVIQVSAGSGNVTQDIINNMPEILLQNPKKVILFIGRNDLANSIPDPTWQANYDDIVNQLEGIGATVLHQLPVPDTGVVQTSLTNYINSTYVNIISVPPTFTTGADTVEGIHPSDTGNAKIYNNQTVFITL